MPNTLTSDQKVNIVIWTVVGIAVAVVAAVLLTVALSPSEPAQVEAAGPPVPAAAPAPPPVELPPPPPDPHNTWVDIGGPAIPGYMTYSHMFVHCDGEQKIVVFTDSSGNINQPPMVQARDVPGNDC